MCIRDRYKYTEYSRIILGLTAVKADVKNVSGYNLLEKLTDMTDVCRQGINGPIWALIAYDSGSYQIPVKRNDETQTPRPVSYTHLDVYKRQVQTMRTLR